MCDMFHVVLKCFLLCWITDYGVERTIEWCSSYKVAVECTERSRKVKLGTVVQLNVHPNPSTLDNHHMKRVVVVVTSTCNQCILLTKLHVRFKPAIQHYVIHFITALLNYYDIPCVFDSFSFPKQKATTSSVQYY